MANGKIETKYANTKVFIAILCVIFLIFLSWLAPTTRTLWNHLDRHVALSCNHLLVSSSYFRSFAIFCNSRTADWIYDFVMIALLILGYKQSQKVPLKILVLAIFLGTTLHIANFRLVSRRLIPTTFAYKRLSPSISIHSFVRAQTIEPLSKTKDQSDHSFPGDHGFTCTLFTFLVTILFGARYGILAFICSLPILLARVWIGAHWLTDIVIGSTLLSLFYISILFYTPIFDTLVRLQNACTNQQKLQSTRRKR